jgi:Fis family transcriptional regulator
MNKIPMPLRRYTRESVRAYLQAINNHHNGQLYDLVIAEVERGLLKEVLIWYNGNQTRACEALGITRTTLRNKIRKLNIDF